MMRWFGAAPFSPVCVRTSHAPTPIAGCAWCDEPFEEDDEGYLIPFLRDEPPPTELGYHVACFLRSIIGSVGHIQRRCHCFGGDEEDPPEMTKRQAAVAAVEAFGARREARGH
jgi:hypothetical protein